MSFETIQAYFEQFGMADRCMDLKESSATVALAALALGTEEARIAKTLSFLVEEAPVVIVAAGDAPISITLSLFGASPVISRSRTV